MSEWVGVIGSWSSILGLLVSVYVLWEVRQIRRQFLLRLRIGDLLQALQNQAAEMSTSLNDFEESHHEVGVIFAHCESTLQNLQSKLSGDEKRQIRNLIKSLRSYHRLGFLRKKRNLDYDEAWRAYTALQGIIESIRHLREDIRSGG